MTADHRTLVYVGLAGEGKYIGAGGCYRRATEDGEWQSLTKGLPPNPQVRAFVVHAHNPAIVYAGTHLGPYRSDGCGEHWEALEAPPKEADVWSLLFHPRDPNVIYAGYQPCAMHGQVYERHASGQNWHKGQLPVEPSRSRRRYAMVCG